MSNKIYFDHASTTPCDPLVIEEMLPYFEHKFGNPSSIHNFGQEAAQAVEKARRIIAKFLNAEPSEVIFTSGATESDNLAIKGLAQYMRKIGGRRIITSKIEHPAVLETCQFLSKEGFDIYYLNVNREGLIDIEELKDAVNKETFLVSLMYVNNEVGTIEPIKEIGEFLKKINIVRQKDRYNKIYFHTDAVQAANLLNCHVDYLGVDLLSLSGHKIYGPKGVGALYCRKGTPLLPIQHGGHHEFGLRSGTINASAIVGFGKAIELVGERNNKDFVKMKKISEKIITTVLKNIRGSEFNGSQNQRNPAHINIRFDNVEGESLLLMLDAAGIAISTGSACASGSLEPSVVLRAMGLSEEKCHGSIRISLGRGNTVREADHFLSLLPDLIKKIRERSPL